MQLRPARHRRAPRLALHLLAVAALAGGSVVLTGGAGHADAAARPDSYGGTSTAAGLHVAADRNPQPTPVTDLVHAEVPYATTDMDSSGSAEASATPMYPGAGLLGVPALLCQVGGCLPLPDFPLMATASYPTKPDAQAQTSPGTIDQGPLDVAPNLTSAHADPNRVEATTQAAHAAVSGVFSADSVASHSKQAFEGNTLVVTADSTVKGIDLGNGALHIDAVRSVAVAHVDGGQVTTSSATTTVTGATAGGTPVTIDSTGVHVAGNGDGGAAQGGANTALAALQATGITVRLLTPTQMAKDGSAAAAAGGLLVTFAQTASLPAVPGGAPVNPNGDYFGSLTVAGAGVTAFATPAVTVDWPTDVPPPPVVAQPAPVVGGVVAPIVPGNPPVPTVATGSSGTRPELATSTATQPVAVLGVDLTDERLRLLTLVLLGYPLLVLLTGPLKARPRSPRLRRT